MRILVIYGTRPEAIKMAPVVRELRARGKRFDTVVCTTAQHRDMLDQVHRAFGLQPDIDLDLMRDNQQLNPLLAGVVTAVDRVLADARPDWLLVQGDTTTAMGASLAAFHRQVRVGHVEAGLRTGDLAHPFPEEANRRLIDVTADLLFAPTVLARDRLLAEGIAPQRVHLTGNTVVDALQSVAAGLAPTDKTNEVLITLHRRESFGRPLQDILAAIAELAAAFPDSRWVYPVHPNPNVRDPVHARLGGIANIDLQAPLDYTELVRHLMRARLVLTDSGGLQEEAPTFATPVLVLRETTERPEGIDAGVARLVGTGRASIVAAATEVLSDPASYAAMAQSTNPYGDGHAAKRIVDILAGLSPDLLQRPD